jgi:hypothetical protein
MRYLISQPNRIHPHHTNTDAFGYLDVRGILSYLSDNINRLLGDIFSRCGKTKKKQEGN